MHVKLSGVPVEEAATTYERIDRQADAREASLRARSSSRTASAYSGGAGRQARSRCRCSPARSLAGRGPDGSDGALVWLESGGPIIYGSSGSASTAVRSCSTSSARCGWTPKATFRSGRRKVTVGRRRVGHFIRLTRLDELPQFWNVLRGDMSFVGPRPERPYFVRQLTAAIPFYPERHAVKPGLTGWAQVKYRYGASIEDASEKLRYDLYYVKHLSLVFDLTIVVDTVKVILFGKGRSMSETSAPHRRAHLGRGPGTVTAVAHNVSTRYLAYVIDAVLGLVMLPFNLSHLGMAAYGVWMLTTSFTRVFRHARSGLWRSAGPVRRAVSRDSATCVRSTRCSARSRSSTPASAPSPTCS